MVGSGLGLELGFGSGLGLGLEFGLGLGLELRFGLGLVRRDACSHTSHPTLG